VCVWPRLAPRRGLSASDLLRFLRRPAALRLYASPLTPVPYASSSPEQIKIVEKPVIQLVEKEIIKEVEVIKEVVVEREVERIVERVVEVSTLAKRSP